MLSTCQHFNLQMYIQVFKTQHHVGIVFWVWNWIWYSRQSVMEMANEALFVRGIYFCVRYFLCFCQLGLRPCFMASGWIFCTNDMIAMIPGTTEWWPGTGTTTRPRHTVRASYLLYICVSSVTGGWQARASTVMAHCQVAMLPSVPSDQCIQCGQVPVQSYCWFLPDFYPTVSHITTGGNWDLRRTGHFLQLLQ